LRLNRVKIKFCDLNWHLDPKFPTIEEILEQFYPNFPQNNRSIDKCYPSLARLAVYATALRNDQKSLIKFLQYIGQKNEGLSLAAVKCIPDVWERVGTLPGLCEAYCTVIRTTRSVDVRDVARINLSELLDQWFSQTYPDNEEIYQNILNLLPISFTRCDNTQQKALIARITLGGWVWVAAFNSANDVDFEVDFKVWGYWLTWGTAADAVSVQSLIIPQCPFHSSNTHRNSIYVLQLCQVFIHSTAT
jgi:hypothetical protein